MIRPVVCKGFLLGIAPRCRTAAVCILKTDDVVYVDEVAGFACVEASGSGGFIAFVLNLRTIIAVRKR